MQRNHRLGILFALAATALFSFKSVVVKSAYRWGVDPSTLLAMRLYFAVPPLLLTLGLRERRRVMSMRGVDLLHIVLLGMLGIALAMAASFASIRYISASLANAITFIYPALTVLVLFLLFGKRVGRGVLIALALTFVGTVLVVGPDRPTLGGDFGLGVGLALVSALAFAFYNAFAERLLERVSTIQISAIGTTAAMLMLIAVNGPLWNDDPIVIAHGAFLGIVCGYLPFLAYPAAIRHAGATTTVVVSTLNPPLTLLWAVLALGESMSALELVGMGAIAVGVLTARLNRYTPPAEPVELPAMAPAAAPSVVSAAAPQAPTVAQ